MDFCGWEEIGMVVVNGHVLRKPINPQPIARTSQRRSCAVDMSQNQV